MFEVHPSFELPSNMGQRVWRYMDLAQLVTILDTKSLHFTRVDKFQDRYEGVYARPTVERLRASEKRFAEEHPEEAKKAKEFFGGLSHWESHRKRFGVSCWHMNDYESAAMWSSYLRSNDGVAIQTTVQQLITAFPAESYDWLVFGGVVKYIDYATEEFSEGNALNPLSYKRKSFEHEREFRLVAIPSRPPSAPGRSPSWDPVDLPEHGVDVPIDVATMIESVYVAPTAKFWFRSAVIAVIKQFGFGFDIFHSSLYDDPVY